MDENDQFVGSLICLYRLHAQTIHITPSPVKAVLQKGTFAICKPMTVRSEGSRRTQREDTKDTKPPDF